MSVILRDGEFVKVPGMDVFLAKLRADIKRQLWTGIQRKDPARAAMMVEQKNDPVNQALESIFGCQAVLTTPEFNYYMRAGAECLTQTK